MSIRYKTESAFKGIIDDAATGLQVLTSQLSQGVVKEPNRVTVRGLGGQKVTSKVGNIRYLVVVSVESHADAGSETESDPVLAHMTRLDAVRALLDDIPGGLAAALSAQTSKPAVSGFTCFGVVPQGEIDDPPATDERIFRDSFGYICTVCESDNS